MSTNVVSEPEVASIPAGEFAERMAHDGHACLIDVRTSMEFQEVHVRGAVNVPLDRLEAATVESIRGEAGTIHVICRSGSRGERACRLLAESGVADVVNVEGGTLACIEAGVPVVRGRAVMSLERQVRIAAGSLVLVGAVLAMTVHVGFAGLSAFVGVGLVFAGVTDTCGMGLMLARMPWNRACEVSGNGATECNTKPGADSNDR